MNREIDWIDGWEVRQGADGTYGVYDQHGMVAGPFEEREKGIKAAMALPRNRGTIFSPLRVMDTGEHG